MRLLFRGFGLKAWEVSNEGTSACHVHVIILSSSCCHHHVVIIIAHVIIMSCSCHRHVMFTPSSCLHHHVAITPLTPRNSKARFRFQPQKPGTQSNSWETPRDSDRPAATAATAAATATPSKWHVQEYGKTTTFLAAWQCI